MHRGHWLHPLGKWCSNNWMLIKFIFVLYPVLIFNTLFGLSTNSGVHKNGSIDPLQNTKFVEFWISTDSQVRTRVTGLHIRNCADIFNNLVQRVSEVSAIGLTENMIFERLYLVSGVCNIALSLTMPSAPTSPPLALQLFLDFCAIFFSSGISIFLSSK